MLAIPPPIWTVLFMAATYFLSDLPMFSAWPLWQKPVAGAVIALIALALAFAAAMQFRRVGTQIRPTSEKNDKLVIDGVFGLTRNPMYSGMTLIALGAALWVGRPLMFAAPVLVFVVANFFFIPFEEAKMRRQFGDQFDAYTKRVRRWI